MPLLPDARITVRATVPPGDSLIGVYPQSLFRIERFHLPVAADVALMHGGIEHPFDGQTLTNASHDRTLCVGHFFAFHVRNKALVPTPLVFEVSGTAVDAPPTQEGHTIVGTFAMEKESPPPEDADLGLEDGDCSQADAKGLG
jgi:hypothetical protein